MCECFVRDLEGCFETSWKCHLLDSEWGPFQLPVQKENVLSGPAFKGPSCQAFSGRLLVVDDSHVCINRA